MTDMRTTADAIGAIYDAAANPSKWSDAMARVARLTNAPRAQIVLIDTVNLRLPFQAGYGLEDVTPADFALFNKLGPKGDPRFQRSLAYPGKAIDCRSLLSDEEWHASPIYSQLLRRYDVEYSLGASFPQANSVVALAALRGKQAGRFDRTECAALDCLIPHFRRAIDLHRHFLETDNVVAAARTAFDAVPLGMLIVNGNAEVRLANRAATEVIADGDALTLDQGRLIAAGAADGALRHHLAEMAKIAFSSHSTAARIIDIPRGRRPALMLTLSVGGKDVSVLRQTWVGEGLVIAYLYDPTRPIERRPEMLQRMFGLTDAEIAVAEAIQSGETVTSIAAQGSGAEGTVRVHLKRAFAKTGAKSQLDLVRLLHELPALD